MRLSFMSWVCPTWSFEEIARYCEDSPYTGIELRVDSNHAHGVSSQSSAAVRERVRTVLDSRGVDLPCIATSHQLATEEGDAEVIDAAKGDVELAGDLDARYVRLFAGGAEESLTDAGIERVARRLNEVGEYARGHGVSPLLETKHDIVRSADDAARILNRVATSNVGVLWNQSTISTSAVERLADRINHVHVHDVVLDSQNDDVHQLVSSLQPIGYDGYISLEVIRGEDIPRDELTATGQRLASQIESAAK